MKQRQETVSGHTPGMGMPGDGLRVDGYTVRYNMDGSVYAVADTTEIARLIALAPTLLSQRDRLAAALRGMLSGAEYVNSRAKAGQRAFMSQTACDDARALLAEIDGEGEA